MLRLILLGFILTVPSILGEKLRFDNYALYKVLPKNVEEIRLLQDFHDSDSRFDFWTDPVPSAEFVNVLSSPGDRSDFEDFLVANEVDFEISNSNVQEAIDKETVKPYTRNNIKSMGWDAYYELDAIYAWIDDLAKAYPNIVTVIIGGSTIEGRQIKGLRISHGAGRRIIFLEGGIHAREWISPATVTYITNELLTSDDEETVSVAKEFDWYIFPVTNPDGYVWSHSSNRMWRKNRRPVKDTFGVDLNRNWNNNWLVVGASSNESRDDYAGLGPFSEPETRSLSTFIESISDKIDLYLSFHSYGQLLLIPFGNTTEPLANYHDAVAIGRRAMGAVSVRYGTQYVTGNIAEAIYKATGGSIDWVKEKLKVPLVYCYELRDKGTHGFVLPPSEIMPNNLEVMDSLIELILQAKRFGYMSGGFEIKASVSLILMAVLTKFLYN